MLEIFYEDDNIIVVKKPAGTESQARNSFEPDMVSQIRNHIHSLSTKAEEPYVGVVHRLDKPVSGIMVYARNREAAADLSRQIQTGRMRKMYKAVVCGRPVDNVDNFVDYLLKDNRQNLSKIVDKCINRAKRAELRYRTLAVVSGEPEISCPLALVEIELLTGRHHQIRVQFAGHGLPLYGDRRYNPAFAENAGKCSGGHAPGTSAAERASGRADILRSGPGSSGPAGYPPLALCACGLSFEHPATGGNMTFSMEPSGGIFEKFSDISKINKILP